VEPLSHDLEHPLSDPLALEFLEQMWEIRAFEEATQRLFTSGLVRGSTHLCQGQEAVSVGACGALRKGDSMLCTYRGHGAVLAMGAPADRTFGEIIGKANGLCGGRGGSMHLTDVSVGAYGSFAIVAAHLPIALGMAFAGRYLKDGSVALCFFGDGAVNIGAFHESMNFASNWKLPVIFVCENNLYGEYTAKRLTTPIERIADRADAYSMAKATIDGNDIRVVYDTVSAAADRARRGDGPTLIEALTYRHKGHSRTDPATYRPQGELETWLARDPILRLEADLATVGVGEAEVAAVRAAAEAKIAAALERAKGWDDPDPESLLEFVLA
jgi:acetoin:2,6-dichlorophenolindophenol oxidoreductase subunit alpha